ncbi:MAG TPA: hypothetical protein VMX55_02670 [candidate division Zixibacteria bacterium]|nr:hypothetical protein [candidate division Zixibacteria bacterium]
MGKTLKKTLSNLVLLAILFYSQLFSISTDVYSQTNLIEEEDHFKVFSGNFYDITIPKGRAPEAYIALSRISEIFLKFNYLSEYQSPGLYMNSLGNLFGKGYNFDYLDWDMVGISNTEKTCVNFTKSNLDRNSSLDLSLTIFNQNTTINNYDVTALKEIFIQVNLTNWMFSDLSRGLALNIFSSLSESEEFTRQGPYTDFPTSTNYVQIYTEKYDFIIKFKTEILIKNILGFYENYEIGIFANYNAVIEEPDPADFWISIPKRTDISQIILSFLCYNDFEETGNGNSASFLILFFSLSSFALVTKVILNKRKVRK